MLETDAIPEILFQCLFVKWLWFQVPLKSLVYRTYVIILLGSNQESPLQSLNQQPQTSPQLSLSSPPSSISPFSSVNQPLPPDMSIFNQQVSQNSQSPLSLEYFNQPQQQQQSQLINFGSAQSAGGKVKLI